ncbi:hypothetical protein ABZX28_10455 [Streptomyces rubiginosohelvolus]|uniref:hypothetical protein n=1 Tax=Streptomyces rubiginosohelvolus TaxID=67362 RepID=UPI0033AA0DA3
MTTNGPRPDRHTARISFTKPPPLTTPHPAAPTRRTTPRTTPLGNSAGKLEEEVPDVPGQQLAASEEYGPSSQAALGRRELAHLDELLAVAQEDFLAPLGATERQALTDLLTRLVDHHRAERG